jgi:hypothetical protein
MGNSRTPGPINDPLTSADDLQSPGAGFHEPGFIGLDATTTTTASVTLSGWPRNIAWDEFAEVGSSPHGEPEDAYTSARFDYPFSWENEGRHYHITRATVTMQMVEAECWAVRGRKTDELLSHEQGHYDITGLMARDLATALETVSASSHSALTTEVERIAGHYRRHARRLNEQYDEETAHGSNRREQDRWHQRIADAISNGTRLAPRP